MVSTIILLLGWGLDFLLGDPERLPHPIVYFGRWISWLERRFNHGPHRMAKGALVALVSIFGVFGLTYIVLHALSHYLHPVVGWGLSVILVFYCLAGHTLRREVRMVFEALDRSLEMGRRQVARIVGRDTTQLSAQEVRTAALETLAENLSDGVIAPIFWYALLGVPGMLAYKMVNTLDSMIGYQTERYKQFGAWAAFIDDIANYVPARIIAFVMVVVGWFYSLTVGRPKSILKHMGFVVKYGPRHTSPNSGWPEAALASLLDCRFGGPHYYFGESVYKPYIGYNPRQLDTPDMKWSILICLLSEWTVVIAISIIFAFTDLINIVT